MRFLESKLVKLSGIFLLLVGAVAAFVLFFYLANRHESQAAETSTYNHPAFATAWARVDRLVAQEPNAGRGYTWGPAYANGVGMTEEPYNGKTRTVQYFDKARMEVNDPNGDPNSLYFVTTGLLVRELVTGERQEGDASFTKLAPSGVQIAGDPNTNGVNANAPTYASFGETDSFADPNAKVARANNAPIRRRIDKAGQVFPFTPPENRLTTGYDDVTGHNIADVFVEFGNRRGKVWNGRAYVEDNIFFGNPTYVIGRPLTEPYWIKAEVGGVPRDILVQLFERRVLTYTPSNPEAFKVEMGNVGQHYFRWRYEEKPTAPPAISEIRFGKLSKGMNLSHWFAHPLEEPVTAAYFRNYIGAQDIEFLRDKGFRYVRLPLDPTLFLDERKPGVIDPFMLEHLDWALDTIIGNHLAVSVDFHPRDPEFKKRLAREPRLREHLVLGWESLSKHLAKRSPGMLFFETLNEPAFEETLQLDNISGDNAIALWQDFQRKLHAAIRANAPRHTIILNTHEYGLPEELNKLQPLNDPNTIYNFHFYQPFVFTHQGADWALDEAKYWQRVPYPSSPDECNRRNWRPDPRGGERIENYCDETWNKARLELLIKPAADWAKRNNVRLIANEFGVYRPAVIPADRAAWLRDVREIFEAYNIGWAMWDYSEGFGLVQPDGNGRRVLDPDTLKALGL